MAARRAMQEEQFIEQPSSKSLLTEMEEDAKCELLACDASRYACW